MQMKICGSEKQSSVEGNFWRNSEGVRFQRNVPPADAHTKASNDSTGQLKLHHPSAASQWGSGQRTGLMIRRSWVRISAWAFSKNFKT